MTEMFGEAWSPMSVPDLAPDDDDRVTSEAVSLSSLVSPLSKLSSHFSTFSLHRVNFIIR